MYKDFHHNTPVTMKTRSNKQGIQNQWDGHVNKTHPNDELP